MTDDIDKQLSELFPTWFKPLQVTFSGELPTNEKDRQQMFVIPHSLFKHSLHQLIQSEVRKARDILQKEVKALVVNDLEAVRAKNKHLDSRLYEHTVSEAGGYIKAIEDVLNRINELKEGKV
jgi:hypothetical protein